MDYLFIYFIRDKVNGGLLILFQSLMSWRFRSTVGCLSCLRVFGNSQREFDCAVFFILPLMYESLLYLALLNS